MVKFPMESPFEKTQKIQSLVPKAFKSSFTSFFLDYPKDNWGDDQKNRL